MKKRVPELLFSGTRFIYVGTKSGFWVHVSRSKNH